MASEFGVDARTVLRAAKQQSALSAIAEETGKSEFEIKDEIGLDKVVLEVADEIKKRPDESPVEIAEEVKEKHVHVSSNSGNNEWYTPAQFIDMARDVLGKIDLDPASCEFANKTVRAKSIFTKEDNGLNKKWIGRIWCNPPYSGKEIKAFSDKVINERNNYKELILLVNNATETRWMQSLFQLCDSVCFPKGRIQYVSQFGKSNSPLQGQVFIYFGDNQKKFQSVFSKIGRVWA